MPDSHRSGGVRNVALVGSSGSGKTTLAHALVAYGAPHAGTTTATDSRIEPTTTLSPATATHDGVRVNLLDTPGDPDFAGALVAGLFSADAALFVVSAVDGIDPRTAALWEVCADAELPRAVVVTQLDRDGADFDESVSLCQRLFGDGVHPLHLPLLHDDESIAGLIDLLTQRVHDWSTGRRVDRHAEPQHLPLIDNLRSELIEAITGESEDETLLDRYLDGEQLPPALLVEALEDAVQAATLHPVLAVAPGLGLDELLDLLTGGFPARQRSPAVTRPDGSPAVPLHADPCGALVAEVLPTPRRQRPPEMSLVRVFSGTLTPGMVVQASAGSTVRVRALHQPDGWATRPVSDCRAGDLCLVAVDHANPAVVLQAGDTLSDPAEPLVIVGREWPEGHHPVALAAARPEEEQQLAEELARLVADDPSARVEHSAAGQLLLWAVGDRHAEALIGQLSVAVTQPVVRVAPESISEVEIRVPPWAAGAVTDDLARRRGRVTGREATEDGTVVRAEVPDAELVRYALRLREISRGTGTLRRRPLDVVREL